MKKMFKLCLGLAMVLVSLVPVNLLAEENTGISMLDIIGQMYEGTTDFRAYDAEGNDITDTLLTDVRQDFLASDEEAIMNYVLLNVDYLHRTIKVTGPSAYSATYTKCYVSEQYGEVLAQTQPTGGGSLAIIYTMTVEPIYLQETSKIISKQQPTITLTSASCPLSLVTLSSLSTQATLSSDSKSCTYAWTFVPRARHTEYSSVYDLGYERVSRSITITPSTYK